MIILIIGLILIWIGGVLVIKGEVEEMEIERTRNAMNVAMDEFEQAIVEYKQTLNKRKRK